MWRGNLLFGHTLAQTILVLFVYFIAKYHKGSPEVLLNELIVLSLLSLIVFQSNHYLYWKFRRSGYTDKWDTTTYIVALFVLLASFISMTSFFQEWVALKLTDKEWPYNYLENATTVHWLFPIAIILSLYAMVYGVRMAIISVIEYGKQKW